MALVPLLAVGVAMRVAETAGALLADSGIITVSSQTASIMTVLLFGVGTDYALIITARYREALLDDPDRPRAMRTAEFVRVAPHTVGGVSLTVAAPSGQYYPDKLINLGNNRWGIKPEIGMSHPMGRWDLDGYVGVWFFSDNTNYYPGQADRSQSPIVATQGHLSYTFARRSWVAFDATYYVGGRVTVDGGEPTERQSNTRVGATLALPAGKSQALKFFYSTGAATRTGTDFNTVGVVWQKIWLGH